MISFPSNIRKNTVQILLYFTFNGNYGLSFRLFDYFSGMSDIPYCFDYWFDKNVSDLRLMMLFYYLQNFILLYLHILILWSYAGLGAQCSVTISHSTCCGYCVRDYRICFQLSSLLSPSVSTLCLKDPRKRVDTIQPVLLLTFK